MRWKDEDGRSLVEFALCASALFLITFGIMGICFALYSYNFVAEAARDASRYAMVRGSSCVGLSGCDMGSNQLTGSALLQTYVQNLSYPGINPANLTATATWSPNDAPGSTVSVTVGYQFPMIIPFSSLNHHVLQMASTSQMVISQ